MSDLYMPALQELLEAEAPAAVMDVIIRPPRLLDDQVIEILARLTESPAEDSKSIVEGLLSLLVRRTLAASRASLVRHQPQPVYRGHFFQTLGHSMMTLSRVRGAVTRQRARPSVLCEDQRDLLEVAPQQEACVRDRRQARSSSRRLYWRRNPRSPLVARS